MAILTGVRWNLSVVLICISFMASDGEHFFMCFWPFEFLLLRNFCLVHLPISLFVHWFWESLVFWSPCILWLSVLCLMCSWQIFSSTLWVVSSVQRLFLLLCRSYLILCSPICLFFLLVAELLEFYWGNPCLCLLLSEYSLRFTVLTSEFQVWY
jgi:hypothetical protein